MAQPWNKSDVGATYDEQGCTYWPELTHQSCPAQGRRFERYLLRQALCRQLLTAPMKLIPKLRYIHPLMVSNALMLKVGRKALPEIFLLGDM